MESKKSRELDRASWHCLMQLSYATLLFMRELELRLAGTTIQPHRYGMTQNLVTRSRCCSILKLSSPYFFAWQRIYAVCPTHYFLRRSMLPILPPGPTLRQTEGKSFCLNCCVAEFDAFFSSRRHKPHDRGRPCNILPLVYSCAAETSGARRCMGDPRHDMRPSAINRRLLVSARLL